MIIRLGKVMNIYLGKVGSINLDMPPWSIAIFNGDISGTIYKRYAGKLIKQQIPVHSPLI